LIWEKEGKTVQIKKSIVYKGFIVVGFWLFPKVRNLTLVFFNPCFEIEEFWDGIPKKRPLKGLHPFFDIIHPSDFGSGIDHAITVSPFFEVSMCNRHIT
jgi:hypothetical protein